MAVKLTWFKFSPTDWFMGKIQRAPEITQARFLRLSCLYWNKSCVLSFEDAEVEIETEHINYLIAKKIIKQQDGFVRIEFLDEQMNNCSQTSEIKRDAAKKRWDNKNAHAMHVHKSALQNDAEKIREDKKRIDKNKDLNPDKSGHVLKFDELLQFIIEKTGRSFTKINDKVKSSYNARLKEGYTREQIGRAVINACKDSFHIENNYKYLTPAFFSRADKLDMWGTDTNVVKVQVTSTIDKSKPHNR